LRVDGNLPHFTLTASEQHGCVSGHATLTVYQNSLPRHLCLLKGASLELVLSDPGEGGVWTRPSTAGTAVAITSYRTLGGGGRATLVASSRGRSLLTSGVDRPYGSELGWALYVQVD
jgi:hypothetical protein